VASPPPAETVTPLLPEQIAPNWTFGAGIPFKTAGARRSYAHIFTSEAGPIVDRSDKVTHFDALSVNTGSTICRPTCLVHDQGALLNLGRYRCLARIRWFGRAPVGAAATIAGTSPLALRQLDRRPNSNNASSRAIGVGNSITAGFQSVYQRLTRTQASLLLAKQMNTRYAFRRCASAPAAVANLLPVNESAGDVHEPTCQPPSPDHEVTATSTTTVPGSRRRSDAVERNKEPANALSISSYAETNGPEALEQQGRRLPRCGPEQHILAPA